MFLRGLKWLLIILTASYLYASIKEHSTACHYDGEEGEYQSPLFI